MVLDDLDSGRLHTQSSAESRDLPSRSAPPSTSRSVRIEVGQELPLPPVATCERHHLGTIHRLLAPSRAVLVAEVDRFKLPSGRYETSCRLSTGERLIVTRRRKLDRPPEIIGVLRLDPESGPPSWLGHELLDAHTTDAATPKELRDQVARSWAGVARWPGLVGSDTGLRPPQVGALLAIGAHWTQHSEAATVVMPTGTGKTETMLACTVAYDCGPILVVVPSAALRDQTADKFIRFGLLRELGFIPAGVANPIVGVLQSRPRTAADLEFFDRCNVVLGTTSVLAQGTAEDLGDEIAARVRTLIVDEAHHVPANSWEKFRERFKGSRVLQFTATPFRRDGRVVDGRVIYSYSLRRAQEDGYFKRIHFSPIEWLNSADADRGIATAAIEQLRKDLAGGLDHRVMARCDSVDRATKVHAIYAALASDLRPVLIYSEAPNAAESLGRLRSGVSRIVVCVDMLGEGFDLPQLKVAAIHDTHKSLAIVLQFIGRFTRTGPKDVGEATAIANIADVNVSDALERLYTEDADWNVLLADLSSHAVQEHADLMAFLQESERLDFVRRAGRQADITIPPRLLRPTCSAVVFKCPTFQPKKFHDGLSREAAVQDVWLHKGTTLFFITRSLLPVRWTSSRQVRDDRWHLFVLHHDAAHGLLFLHSSDPESLHEDLARAVGATGAVQGDRVFRVLGRIGRLVFQNIGVKKPGRRNLRFAMYTGADVKFALTPGQRQGSVKSNLSGTGWEGGRPVAIGCSQKGKVWTKAQGPIRRFIAWCQKTAEKLCDEDIDTADILEHVLIPDEVTEVPPEMVLGIDWPDVLLQHAEERVELGWVDERGSHDAPLSLFELSFVARTDRTVTFELASEDLCSRFALTLDGVAYRVDHVSGPTVSIQIGREPVALEKFFTDYPPLLRFADLSELDGNLLTKLESPRPLSMPMERFEAWDWDDVDITEESMWKDGKLRPRSIQEHAAKRYIADGYGVVFDDDARGEAADLVCIREGPDAIDVTLVHCKFSRSAEPGERIKDVVEVCSQAVRSHKWAWRFRELCRHISDRETRLRKPHRSTRFLKGTAKDALQMAQSSRAKPTNVKIVIAQPGLQKSKVNDEQAVVLAAAHGFLQDTVGADLTIVCSE